MEERNRQFNVNKLDFNLLSIEQLENNQGYTGIEKL